MELFNNGTYKFQINVTNIETAFLSLLNYYDYNNQARQRNILLMRGCHDGIFTIISLPNQTLEIFTIEINILINIAQKCLLSKKISKWYTKTKQDIEHNNIKKYFACKRIQFWFLKNFYLNPHHKIGQRTILKEYLKD